MKASEIRKLETSTGKFAYLAQIADGKKLFLLREIAAQLAEMNERGEAVLALEHHGPTMSGYAQDVKKKEAAMSGTMLDECRAHDAPAQQHFPIDRTDEYESRVDASRQPAPTQPADDDGWK